MQTRLSLKDERCFRVRMMVDKGKEMGLNNRQFV